MSQECLGLDKNELFDLYRQFRPSAQRDEFEREWDEYLRLKNLHLEKLAVQ